MSDMVIRSVQLADLDRCFEIETVSYGGDEAASKEKIAKRITTYPEGFIVAENEKEIVGFVNAGAAHEVELSDEEFKELIGHDPEGKHIVIMSVVVHPDYQGKGIAGVLMRAFIERMKEMDKADIYLICQTELIDMYAKFGFVHLGESDSDHGGLSWHEMVLNLAAQRYFFSLYEKQKAAFDRAAFCFCGEVEVTRMYLLFQYQEGEQIVLPCPVHLCKFR